ncbi:MAG TPA: tRNA (adenosine(37)-N6)-dimethylallyltransferase MiaA [Firmicutes bacterium]|nr:tRNA (adenosine(37)-N6)-dimethylallyltransferase MiaA [Bacillota bacterium]
MIVCIIGPTSVGKTRLSEELALKFDAIIINNDAMQVYKYMNIGTAKYTKEEDLGQEHYLFDIVSPNEMYTVFDYQRDARRVIDENRNRNIVMVGGTGLYLKAALYDYEFSERDTCEFDEYSNEELYDILREKGDIEGVHINNRRRLVSRLNSSGHHGGKDRLLYDDVILIGLTTDRAILHEKIEKRTSEMVEGGLLDEVRELYAQYGETKALKTGICYKEVIAYFKGLLTKDEMIRLINQKCRQYAKRQYTWFNHQMDVKWFDVDYDNFSNTIEQVYEYIEMKRKK